jgi:hypothetical protein
VTCEERLSFPGHYPRPDVSRNPLNGNLVVLSTYRLDFGNLTLVIPRGFEYDGASIPRIARPFIDRQDLGEIGVLGHDFIYHYAGQMPPGSVLIRHESGLSEINFSTYTIPRSVADLVMVHGMELDGVARAVQATAYQGVRRFGWWPWWRAERRMRREP